MLCIAFEAGDKEYSVVCQLVIPTVVVVAFINRNNTPLWKVQSTPHRNVGIFTIGYRDKLRKVTGVIQPHVQLYRPFGGSKVRPRKDRQTQVYG